MTQLTERAVARAKTRAVKYEISCSALSGFTLRVLPSGKKIYYIRCRDSGKDRRVRIGATTEISFADARRIAATRLSADVESLNGGAESLKPSSRRRRSAAGSPIFKDFAERFLREHVDVHLKTSSRRVYRQFIDTRLIPSFGPRRLDEIDFADIARFHASYSDTPYAANLSLRVLSSIYTRAIEWGVLERGFMPPTRGIKKYKMRSRERFLAPRERARLERFLELAIQGRHRLSWHAVAAIRLLSMTGMRRDEVLDLTWDMVDFRHRCFRLPDSKTGQKIVPVSERALDLIRECRQKWKDCRHEPKPANVIYSRNGKRLLSCSLTKTWCTRVRDRIPGFQDVRLHDLRHSMASDAIMAGVPLAVVGKILGHRKPETTARYAHIADSVLSDAVEKVSDAMQRSAKTGRAHPTSLGEEELRSPDEERVRLTGKTVAR